jgi:hypothetical protein
MIINNIRKSISNNVNTCFRSMYCTQGCREVENIGGRGRSTIFSGFFQKFCINSWNFRNLSSKKNEIFDYWVRGSPTRPPPPARDTPDCTPLQNFLDPPLVFWLLFDFFQLSNDSAMICLRYLKKMCWISHHKYSIWEERRTEYETQLLRQQLLRIILFCFSLRMKVWLKIIWGNLYSIILGNPVSSKYTHAKTWLARAPATKTWMAEIWTK